MATTRTPTGDRVVLFDGVCNLCAASVRFIVRRDPNACFRFATLQSDAARQLLIRHQQPADKFDSVVLIEDGRVFEKSTAALRIARRLTFPWPLFFALVVVPRAIRDAVYSFVVRRRYRWFGRSDACMLPTPDLQHRFLS